MPPPVYKIRGHESPTSDFGHHVYKIPVHVWILYTPCPHMCTTCLCVPGFAPPQRARSGAVFLVSQILSPSGGRGPGFSRKFVRLVLLLRQNLATCVIFPRPVETKPQTQSLVTAILPVAPAGSGHLPWLCLGGLPAWTRFLCVGRLARLRCYVHIAQPCWGPAACAVACRAVVRWAVWGRGRRVCRAEGLCGWPCVVLRLPRCRGRHVQRGKWDLAVRVKHVNRFGGRQWGWLCGLLAGDFLLVGGRVGGVPGACALEPALDGKCGTSCRAWRHAGYNTQLATQHQHQKSCFWTFLIFRKNSDQNVPFWSVWGTFHFRWHVHYNIWRPSSFL